jgi:intracellular multiplication protein IcmL
MPASQLKKTNKVTFTIKVLSIIGILLAVGVYYYFTHRKEPAYGAIYNYQNKNYLIPMTPLSQPIINSQALLIWSSEAATAAYTYDAANYQAQFAVVINKYFTKKGGQAFMSALQNSGSISNLLSKKLVVTSVVNGSPLILKQGILLGKESWRIQVPVLVDYQSASEIQTASYIITMLIVRTNPADNPQGIGIEQFSVNQTT